VILDVRQEDEETDLSFRSVGRFAVAGSFVGFHVASGVLARAQHEFSQCLHQQPADD
jgi:hypothetical protein